MDDVIRQIERTFESLTDPKFFFVSEMLRARPYDDLVRQVTGDFAVTEDTDEDDDLAFGHLLSRGGRLWAMAISMVGPYALFARITQAWDDILTPSSTGLSKPERRLMSGLTGAGLRLLSREELERPVALNLTGPSDVRVYHALFSDTDGLPWDKAALRRLGLID